MDVYAPVSFVITNGVQNVECSQSELINESLVIFVVATTGTGREPRAMTPLWQMLLRADLPEDLFEDLTFAVFGLGDTSYAKFCSIFEAPICCISLSIILSIFLTIRRPFGNSVYIPEDDCLM